jgi:hypothetical protein
MHLRMKNTLKNNQNHTLILTSTKRDVSLTIKLNKIAKEDLMDLKLII